MAESVRRGIIPTLDPVNFDLVKEAELRRRMITAKYQQTGHMIFSHYPREAVLVNLDRSLVGQIIYDLLDNACKYSPVRSGVRLKVSASGRRAWVSVSDCGPGLPPNVERSLYQMGIRGQGTKTQGLGLGLFRVRRHVDWLEGRIDYLSSAEGGTEFTVELPRGEWSQK